MNSYKNFETMSYFENHTIFIDVGNKNGITGISDTLELFCFILSKYSNESILGVEIIGKSENLGYIERIGFLESLKFLFGMNRKNEFFTPNSNNDVFGEMKIFKNKNEFYAFGEKILHILKDIGLSDNASYGVFSSLSEVIDNSFFHNLGRWETSFGPLCIFFGHNDLVTRKISFVINDLGVGFKKTLHGNYPNITNEEEAIKLALLPKVTGRYQNKGGNGLVYLQNNIFNGFRGELFIRSNDTLGKVKSLGNIEILKKNVSIIGSSLHFSLFY